jgi:hypothetical protein
MSVNQSAAPQTLSDLTKELPEHLLTAQVLRFLIRAEDIGARRERADRSAAALASVRLSSSRPS